MSHAACNDETIRNWEHVSHTITRVDNSACEISFAHSARFGAGYLCVKSQCGLNTNEQTFHIESLKHDLGHLLSILWGVKRRLSQNKSVLLRLASQLRVDGAMPELLHRFPVLNLSATNDILQVVCLLVQECIVADVVIEFGVGEILALASRLGLALVDRIGDHSWNEIARLHVARISHLGVTCAIINDYSGEFAHFKIL